MKLTVTGEQGQGVQEVTDKEDIERILMQVNKEKFQEANATSFMQDPLRSDVGPRGTTVAAEQILLGTYAVPDSIDENTVNFLQALQMPDAVRLSEHVETDISLDEHIKFWRKARESTQSSMSGMHFGFYRATAQSPQIVLTVINFVRIPIQGGYSTDRFSNSLNVSIQKED